MNFFCNKCGYYGPVQYPHPIPKRPEGNCNYYAYEVKDSTTSPESQEGRKA